MRHLALSVRQTRVLAPVVVVMILALVVTHRLSGQQPDREETLPERQSPRIVAAEIIRVIDGDTIAVRANALLPDNDSEHPGEHIVRLLGIDAPEMSYRSSQQIECGAQEALDQLEALLKPHADVELTYDERSDSQDRYGRSLAYVGTPVALDVALRLVEEGYVAAWYPSATEPEPARFKAYERAQAKARASAAGSWRRCDDGLERD